MQYAELGRAERDQAADQASEELPGRAEQDRPQPDPDDGQ
jgi:hypothetical protein